jgi:hypothetical protein
MKELGWSWADMVSMPVPAYIILLDEMDRWKKMEERESKKASRGKK